MIGFALNAPSESNLHESLKNIRIRHYFDKTEHQNINEEGLKNLYNNLSFIQLGNFISLVDDGLGPSTDIEKLNLILNSKIHWTQNIQPTRLMLIGSSVKFFSRFTDFYFDQLIWDDLLYQSFLNEMDELVIPEILERLSI